MDTLYARLLSEFQLPTESIHGPSHWKRVETYGLHLARHNGADPSVVRLFAYFHDCCRIAEEFDPDHGLRAAQKAREMSSALKLTDEALETLYQACAGHTDLKFSHDPTIGACWDADRLDLDRVGVDTDPDFFSTTEGKRLARLPAISRRLEVGITLNLTPKPED